MRFNNLPVLAFGLPAGNPHGARWKRASPAYASTSCQASDISD
jgi:hypothetical protein